MAAMPLCAPGMGEHKHKRHAWDIQREGNSIMSTATASASAQRVKDELADKNHRMVVFASSLGTVFEWYDFYLYGTLATFFAALFFPKGNETAALLSAFATFGAGFLVRPFGAIVFGYLGDMIGRKHTFLVTILLMGVSTAAVGLLPTFEQIGYWAPALMLLLRLIQGLALGGEYGGAATYVAEHAPANKRGFYTSWIQTTATLGFFLSLLVIAVCRGVMSEDDFKSWGWRVPFLVSVVLLGISVWIRLKLSESPVFQEMKREGATSKNPLKESFGHWYNMKYVLIALFGATAGQGVVWYMGQFYALFFLEKTLNVDFATSYMLIAIALAIGTPFFIFFGALSDRIGRKKIMLAGFLLAALTAIPIFKSIAHYANPGLFAAMAQAPVTVEGNDCAFRVFVASGVTKLSACDKARDYLNKKGITYTMKPAGADVTDVRVTIGGATGTVLNGFADVDGKKADDIYKDALKTAGYPTKADESKMNKPMIIALLSILMIYVAMVYGPIAAFLVELFPAKIRYTSMSVPYHFGNGWFGGMLPLLSAAIVATTGNIYAGLWYPIAIAVMSLVIGAITLPETKDREVHHEAKYQ
jgi:MFS family permease